MTTPCFISFPVVLSAVLVACHPKNDTPVADTGSSTSEPTTGSGPSTSELTTEPEPASCNEDGTCDDGESFALCPKDCKCGNGKLDKGEACDDGVNSSNDAYHHGDPHDAPCNSACGKVPFCGDGACQEEEENTRNCPQDPCVPPCGNGKPDAGESCDDGNLENTDACLNNCKLASCGDGFVQAGVEQCDDTNLSDSDACTKKCEMAICGDGLTWVGTEECDDANADEFDTCDAMCKFVIRRKVFVSSVKYPGNLGGLAGADAKCQTLAWAKGLSGGFKAWLSDGIDGPYDRFDTTFSGVYVLVDGAPVAYGWPDLTDGELTHPIDLTEKGDGMNTTVWSNTTPTGARLGTNHCENWGNSSKRLSGSYGLSAAADSSWTNSSTVVCSGGNSIYCFEDPA